MKEETEFRKRAENYTPSQRTSLIKVLRKLHDKGSIMKLNILEGLPHEQLPDYDKDKYPEIISETTFQEQKEPETLKEKIDDGVMRIPPERLIAIVSAVDMETRLGDFDQFTNDELKEAYRVLFENIHDPPRADETVVINALYDEVKKREVQYD